MAPRYYGDRIEQNIAVTDASEQHLQAVRELATTGGDSKVVPIRKAGEGS